MINMDKLNMDDFELPVSEEMLGAYLEGNLSDSESFEVEQLLNIDDNLNQLIDEVSFEKTDDTVFANDIDIFNVDIPVVEELEEVACSDNSSDNSSDFDLDNNDVDIEETGNDDTDDNFQDSSDDDDSDIDF